MNDLTNRVALITGASRGLGRHLALRLADAGMRLALCARSGDELYEVAKAVTDAGGHAYSESVNVRRHGEVERFVADVIDEYGQIDVLVNNAGSSVYKPFAEWTIDEIERTIEVNLMGTLYMTHAVLPHMLTQRSGQILNVASDIGRRAIPNMGPYVAAKHGVVGFTGSLVREVKDHGIRAMVLLPGMIDTYFHGGAEGDFEPDAAMPPAHVADVIHGLLTQPPHLLLDEVTIHPIGQDF